VSLSKKKSVIGAG